MVFLLVDDEPAPLKELTMAVREAMPESEIHAFQWSKDALAFAGEHNVDAAFLDVNMPETDGIELARRLKTLQNGINVVFCTGYGNYMPQAFSLHASGYVMKPVTADAIREELNYLRFDPNSAGKTGETPVRRYRIKTFGDFTLFIDGKPATFSRTKAKELLAYLVDRKGSGVSRKELAAVMFEDAPYDRNAQNYLTKIIKALQDSLTAAGAPEILIAGANQYSVDTRLLDCDLYDFCDGDEKARKQYLGEYMNQYSWAEMTRMYLEDILAKEG